jgi:hypothetical protein
MFWQCAAFGRVKPLAKSNVYVLRPKRPALQAILAIYAPRVVQCVNY